MAIKDFAKNRERDKNGRFIVLKIPSGFDVREYRKRYHLLHKAMEVDRAAKWNKKNKIRRAEIRKKWKSLNRGKVNFLNRLHIYRKRGAGGYPTEEQIEKLYSNYHGLCAYCGFEMAKSIDHIIPISRGGGNEIKNLLPACISCNSSKGMRLLEEWKPQFKLQ